MRILGFEIKRASDVEQPVSFAPQTNDDGAVNVTAGGAFGTYVDLDGSIRTEAELVNKYRQMVGNPEIDAAVDDITNEAIVSEEGEETVQLILDDVPVKENLKNVLRDEFKEIQRLLEFNTKSYDIFKRWYVDGRLYYHQIIDEKQPEAGIKELRYLDPRKIRKIREVIKKRAPGEQGQGMSVTKTGKEYFIYNERGLQSGNKSISPNSSMTGVKIAKDAILHCTSGLQDVNNTMVLSHLHKAIRGLNQLRALEDATLIYRISRAPERRIFYIDVGNLPKMKAEQYLKDIMTKYKNRLVYDANTGEIRDDRRFQCYTLDTKIPLLDGRTLEIREIIEEYNSGKTNWVYSCDPKTGKFVPGPVSWAGVTKKSSDVVRVTFDNGKSVICTPDHKFPVWNKGFVEAKDLAVGESLIPGYRRYKSITTGGVEYEQIYKNETKEWEFTHREVEKWKKEVNLSESFVHNPKYFKNKKSVIHHKDFNRFNNDPENLIMMNHADHNQYHKDVQSILYPNSIIEYVESLVKKHFTAVSIVDYLNSNNNLLSLWKEVNKDRHIKNKNMMIFTVKDIRRIGELLGFKTYRAWKSYHDNRPREASGGLKRAECDKYSIEWKRKLSIAAKNRKKVYCKTWKVVCPDGEQLIVENLNQFCKENSLNRSNIKYKHSKGYTAEILHNHKVVSVEVLDEKMTVAALTIDKEETYHSHHTYLLDAGVYTKNTMLEDYWLPRREGGKGTEITTLPAGQNLGELADVQYFQRKLYKSLNVPISRLEPETTYNVGRATEITRDELKFAKFIDRLRLKFSELFLNALETNLILKGILTPDDWEGISHLIKFKFLHDNYFAELKQSEIMSERFNRLRDADDYAGKYVSHVWIRRNILKQTDEEIININNEIMQELQDPQYNPPMESPPEDPNMQQGPPQ